MNSYFKPLRRKIGVLTRLRIIESNYGRDFGWYVEVEGRKIARLSDPRIVEMFWVDYQLEPLTENVEDRALLYSSEFWDSCAAVYRNCEFNEVACAGFAGGYRLAKRLREEGRIEMRGLYLNVTSYPWGELIIWFMRLRKKLQR